MLAPLLPTAMLAGCGAPARLEPPRAGIAVSVGSPAAAPDTLVSLAAGHGITCVTTAAGAGYCWGSVVPTSGAVSRLLRADGRPADVASVTGWWTTRCALTLDGEAWCDHGLTYDWADSLGRPVGGRDTCLLGACVAPLPMRGALPEGPLRAVTTGSDHACALALDGTAFCWGRNNMGQLGNGTWTVGSTGAAGVLTQPPTAVVGGLRFAQLSAGEMMTCGVTSRDGAVYCWGYGQSGQTGDSTITTYCAGQRPFVNRPCSNAVPARVLPESLPGSRIRPVDVRFVRADAGMRLACGISADGGAWCWGGNYRCALGRCDAPDSPRAHRIQVPGRVVEIGAGYWHACARTADRRVFCWGDNREGQLGSLVTANAGPDGMPPDYRDTTDLAALAAARGADPCYQGGRCSPAAVEVSPGRRWSALAVGSGHACALAEVDGGVYCWGGTDMMALGPDARLVSCENRRADWPDVHCQPTPVRVPGLPRLMTRGDGVGDPLGPTRGSQSSEAGTRVLVSRREARVVFPRDTARVWGWSASRSVDYNPWYSWGVTVEGIDGPQRIGLRVGRTGGRARAFRSLDSLVAAGRVERCEPRLFGACTDSGLTAGVDSGRVVLVLRDSARIAALFGLRPQWVRPSRRTPDDPYSLWLWSERVRVEYVAPQIPEPDSAFRAEAARRRRAYEARVNWIGRSIVGGVQGGGTLWLVVGDSTALRVVESWCHDDVCTGGPGVERDSGWAVADPSIARLRVTPPDTALPQLSSPPVHVVARRPGRTTLRVWGLRGDADTLPSRTPVARALSLDVVVTRPIGRVEIGPHPDTIVVHGQVDVTVLVLDRTGRALERVPVPITVVEARQRQVLRGANPTSMSFGTPGRRMLVASFGGRADTSYVHVVARPAP